MWLTYEVRTSPERKFFPRINPPQPRLCKSRVSLIRVYTYKKAQLDKWIRIKFSNFDSPLV